MLLRSVRAAEWDVLAKLDDSGWSRLVSEILGRGTDVSVFAVIDPDDRERIAVALSAGRRHVRNFDSIEILGSDLDALGLRCRRTPGTTGVPEVDALHRVIDLDEQSASRLIRHLAARGTRRARVRKEALRASARRLCDAGRITLPENSWLLSHEND